MRNLWIRWNIDRMNRRAVRKGQSSSYEYYCTRQRDGVDCDLPVSPGSFVLWGCVCVLHLGRLLD